MKKFYIIILFLLLFVSILSAAPDNDFLYWKLEGKNAALFKGDKKVFDNQIPLKAFPEGFTVEEKIQFSLFLAEYYLNKNDKDGLANILYIIRTQKDDLKLADTFITANWFLDRNDNNSAKKKLDDYISLENNQYLKTLALAIKQMLLDRSSKKGLQVSDLRCSPKHPYFMLCNIARLRIRLEAVENESSYFERNYLNLDRILAPFFEIPSLSYVYFLDRLVYNLGPRLAYLGFAYEASFFQQSIIFSEKLSSFFNVISYERLAFYQVLSGALLEAESTLNEAIAQLGTKEYLKNSLYLRLGAISYLRKDYSRSLQYYLSLNLKYWGKRMRNPFYDRVLSVNGARDLISVSIWKSKSASQAILALSKIKTGTRLNEDDLFIKLRIAQIMFQDRPEISQKITNEIIYQAQSKGWKRVEYAATILNGFTHIKTNSYRRAVIQFTKSYGILGKSDLKFTSEWLRQQGLYLSKSLRGQRGLFYKNIPHLLSLMHQEEINENVMMLKNYVSSSYNIEGFLNRCIEEYRKKNRIEDIFELIYNYEASKIKTNPIINKGLLQIVAVNERIRLYKGMKPSQDNKFLKGNWTTLRKKATELIPSRNKINSKVLKKIKLPFLAALEHNHKVYIFSYKPSGKSGNWTLTVKNKKDWENESVILSALDSVAFLKDKLKAQIFFNREGMDLYRIISLKYKHASVGLFYSFLNPSTSEKKFTLTPISGLCGTETFPTIKYLSPDYFEGTRLFPDKHRLHIWDFPLEPATERKGDYSWNCGKEGTISLKRLQRRMDYRIVPESLLTTYRSLPIQKELHLTPDFYDWTDFWFQKGVNHLYYIPVLEKSKNSLELLEIMKKPIQKEEDWIRFQEQARQTGYQVLSITRTMQ